MEADCCVDCSKLIFEFSFTLAYFTAVKSAIHFTCMSPILILSCVLAYSVLLFFITWLTARNAGNEDFYRGSKSSPWFVVAYGMIGASLSGVTFMSVPGQVGVNHFTYFYIVLGYLLGYMVIATVLMPMYYRLNLTSIYTYLEQRFGTKSYRTGAFFFLLSRTIGASFRLYLVLNVLQTFVFDAMGVPFIITGAGFILLILLYTYQGGIKTIIWTDTLQTTFMLLAVVMTIVLISKEMHTSIGGLIAQVRSSEYSNALITDWTDKRHFVKQLLSGMFISIAMTGLDQEMMQKNLSCRNIKEAQKNMFTFSGVLVFVNLMFLMLGAVLYIYSQSKGLTIPAKTDNLFPFIALNQLGAFAGIIFIIGLISAAYPSADGALTSLTTSVCVDFLGLPTHKTYTEEKKTRVRKLVHLSFADLLFGLLPFFFCTRAKEKHKGSITKAIKRGSFFIKQTDFFCKISKSNIYLMISLDLLLINKRPR
jgi:Na+/proline symporter